MYFQTCVETVGSDDNLKCDASLERILPSSNLQMEDGQHRKEGSVETERWLDGAWCIDEQVGIRIAL